MVLPNSWTTINTGDEILYDDHMSDLKTNADYLDDNPGCGAHNSSYDATKDNTVDGDKDATVNGTDDGLYYLTNYSSVDNPDHGTDNAVRDVGYDGALYTSRHNPRYLTKYTGQNYSVNNPYYSSYYSANYSYNHSSKR
jgi:hypothetical protein